MSQTQPVGWRSGDSPDDSLIACGHGEGLTVHSTGAVGESGVKLACARGPGDSPCLRSSRHDGVWTVDPRVGRRPDESTDRTRSQRFIGSADSRRRWVRVAVPGRRTAGQWRRLTHDSVGNRAEVGESMAGPRASLCVHSGASASACEVSDTST
jgi:hypothetical protein